MGDEGLFVVYDCGWKYYVNLNDCQCTCGEFACRHIKIATDIKKYNGFEFKYLLLSAMHKEIRRSDVNRAFHYARMLTAIYGNNFVSRYCKKIIFEETRNPNLINYLGHSWEADVTTISTAVKKWELPNRAGHVVRKSKAYQDAVRMGPVTDANLFNKDSYYDALTEFLRLNKFKSDQLLISEFKRLADIAPENPIGVLAKNSSEKLSLYEYMTGLEIYYGLVKSEDHKFYDVSAPAEDGDDILYPRDYVHDIHSRQGVRSLHKNWKNIRPSKPLPGGLDLRWSGSVLGCLWRESAYHQFGPEYRKIPWQQVKISDKDWSEAKIFDGMFYKKFYADVEPGALISRAI